MDDILRVSLCLASPPLNTETRVIFLNTQDSIKILWGKNRVSGVRGKRVKQKADGY